MTDINDLIAQGPGRRDFGPLGDVFNAYRQGVQTRREDELAAARRELGAFVGADGWPDYRAAGLHLLRSGDINGALALARLAGAPGRQAQAARGSYGRSSPTSEAPDDVMPSTVDSQERTPAAPVGAPKVMTREQVQAVIMEAQAAIRAGKDPGLVTKRLRDLGIETLRLAP